MWVLSVMSCFTADILLLFYRQFLISIFVYQMNHIEYIAKSMGNIDFFKGLLPPIWAILFDPFYPFYPFDKKK